MINLIVRWVIYALLIMLVAWLIPGISVANFVTAMIVCVVIALINTFIKPLIELIALPVNALTLGLFTLVIDALLLMLAGYITPGFEVAGFISALLGSLVLSVCSIFVSNI